MVVAKNVQYLADYYKVDAKELARLVRALRYSMRAGASFDEAHDILKRIDRLLGNHGVEYLRTENNRWAAYYSNSGDTYRPTVMLQTRPRWSILVGRDWGSYVERYDAGET